jgi:lipopolysaccharide/colanic/teichoic acid biosynthesis glycosyltransferase
MATEIILKRGVYDFIKRCFDLMLAFIFLILLSPLFIIISIAVKISSRGPIIYKQERIGKNSKSFVFYKFRSMTYTKAGFLWTDRDDSRITELGKILRQTHLDELPQLFNVLKGEMSLIGPRPERTELVEIYKQLPNYQIRHSVKPGISGWAQLNFKPSTSLEEAREKLKYDIYYIENQSFAFDLLIFLKTIKYLITSPF